MNARQISSLACAGSLALLTACGTAPRNDQAIGYGSGYPTTGSSAPVYQNNNQYPSQYAQYGQVGRIDVIANSARTSGAGAVLGAVLGGVIGNQIGSGTGRAVATGVGVVGGAVAGNAIESRTRRENEVFRVGVRYDDGTYREYDFQRIDDLQVGDRVKFESGQLYRT